MSLTFPYAGRARRDDSPPSPPTGFPPLPARKALGELAGKQPTVVCDAREVQPLPIARLPVIRGTLGTADYSYVGAQHTFGVERKVATGDLLSSLTTDRERFERELVRLRGFRFARLLIVGSRADVKAGNYRSKAAPKAILGSLSAFDVRYGVPVVWADTPEEAAHLVERWVWYHAREAVLAVNCLLADPAPEPASMDIS